MVGGKRQRGRKPLMGSHQKCWLWGRHVVLETLRAGRWKPYCVWVSAEFDEAMRQQVTAAADRCGACVEVREPAEITRRCGSDEHQGLIAQMPPFPYYAEAGLIEPAAECPLFLVLDGIQDPFNFGSLLRAADVFGVDGVFVGRRNQSAVSAQVVRSSAGAINHVRLAEVSDLCELAGRLIAKGVALVAADGDAELEASEQDFSRPTALVIGNEGSGIQRDLLAKCSESVRIPQYGRVSSLNAAMAGGILLYEICRQRSLRRGASDGLSRTAEHTKPAGD
ncbi:MAG: RNA methyltransferase [Planctomycetota bacterium]|nr:MAG: RNA methyltransferase [Planctomycetota bacterium]REJ85594.1 MAG: RNA methyltransferase [Planctomycetota bacterium]REK26057.1 MAG: RNA methyltransferase [Planctomycetota bacterium]